MKSRQKKQTDAMNKRELIAYVCVFRIVCCVDFTKRNVIKDENEKKEKN